MSASPRAHIYRLILVLVLVAVGFLVVQGFAIPTSWDSQNWYRKDALTELQELPLRFGGNESCASGNCHDGAKPVRHQIRIDTLSNGTHQGLACEGCHGPLSDHVQGGRKVNIARLDFTNDLCLRCHQELVSRPQDFAHFSETFLYHQLLDVKITKPCRACHDPHEPK